MFERFTERARQVIVLSQEEARGMKHNYIGSEHLLLGLLREEDGQAARLLKLHVNVGDARQWVRQVIGEGSEVTTGQIPFTPRAKKILELALREALSLGHNYVGTEHILLGMVRDNGGVGIRYLNDNGLPSDEIRELMMTQLTGPSIRALAEKHLGPTRTHRTRAESRPLPGYEQNLLAARRLCEDARAVFAGSFRGEKYVEHFKQLEADLSEEWAKWYGPKRDAPPAM